MSMNIGAGFSDLSSMLGSNVFQSFNAEKLKKYMVDNGTGYSQFEAVENDGMCFGIGSVMVILHTRL